MEVTITRDPNDRSEASPPVLRLEDLTMVIALRLHEENPWVLARLKMLATWYTPMPPILIVDFGSRDGYRRQLAAASVEGNFEHIYADEKGPFSLSAARNMGAVACQTPFIFFNDIDCFGSRDFFSRLLQHAKSIMFNCYFDKIVDIPVYHLERGSSHGTNPAQVELSMSNSIYDNRVVDFIAPYSNTFLCSRQFFSFIGGYNRKFKGHGSEDFEFLLRFALVSEQFPVPAAVLDDCYGPLSLESSRNERPYRGFRRLFELMALPAAEAGLRVAHLHHAGGPRRSWKDTQKHQPRQFLQQASQYVGSRLALIEYDWLPRSVTAIVVVGRGVSLEAHLSLRLLGYRLVPCDLTCGHGRERCRLELKRARNAVLVMPGDAVTKNEHEMIRLASSHGVRVHDLAGGGPSGTMRLPRRADGADHAGFDRGLRDKKGQNEDPRASSSAGFVAEFSNGKLCALTPGLLDTRRASLDCPVRTGSYAMARVGAAQPRTRRAGSLEGRLRKAVRNPRKFCSESRFLLLRRLGRWLERIDGVRSVGR